MIFFPGSAKFSLRPILLRPGNPPFPFLSSLPDSRFRLATFASHGSAPAITPEYTSIYHNSSSNSPDAHHARCRIRGSLINIFHPLPRFAVLIHAFFLPCPAFFQAPPSGPNIVRLPFFLARSRLDFSKFCSFPESDPAEGPHAHPRCFYRTFFPFVPRSSRAGYRGKRSVLYLLPGPAFATFLRAPPTVTAFPKTLPRPCVVRPFAHLRTSHPSTCTRKALVKKNISSGNDCLGKNAPFSSCTNKFFRGSRGKENAYYSLRLFRSLGKCLGGKKKE